MWYIFCNIWESPKSNEENSAWKLSLFVFLKCLRQWFLFQENYNFYYNDSHSVSYIYVGFFLKGSSVALKNDQITKLFFLQFPWGNTDPNRYGMFASNWFIDILASL